MRGTWEPKDFGNADDEGRLYKHNFAYTVPGSSTSSKVYLGKVYAKTQEQAREYLEDKDIDIHVMRTDKYGSKTL